MSTNNNPIIPISGSSNIISQIKTAAGNIINPMSGSGYIYAPYVPLQTTTINMSITLKPITTFTLFSSIVSEKSYQIALGQKYKFLSDHTKDTYKIDPFAHRFKIDDMFFITEITETKDEFHAYPVAENTSVDYLIKVISLDSENNDFIFKSKEFLHNLENQRMVII